MSKILEQVNAHPMVALAAIAVSSFTLGFLTANHTEPKKVEVQKIIEKPVVIKVPTKLDNNDRQQIKCLADNAYYEAGNQSVKGKVAVTNVVMNRTKEAETFAKTPCGVVKQKKDGHCQFSWVCHTKNHKVDADSYMQSYKVAENVYLNNITDVTLGATYYHASYVYPGWHMRETTQIGQHIFYKG
jgi:spore germination cell wall hydrolase CwlJ-like protein